MTLPPAPYPGLRAFRPDEALIFCGRAAHRVEVLNLLGRTRFLAVVGASGSGKSSLVLAGLLPDIREGRLIGVEGETVRIVTAQPGLRPFANLASALAAELKTDLSLEPVLRRGPSGFVQVLDEVENEPDRALILVIDQFEEIFRFADMDEKRLALEDRHYAGKPLVDGPENEAQAFVNLLLETAVQTRHVVYVLITMRSEFLSRCDQFSGLPETISRSQFLTPRLNRQQLEQAIVRPLGYFEADIDPHLVSLILNQISPEQDQLPLMQHALARMWELHRTPNAGEAGSIRLSVKDYTTVGGIADALNKHGDALCQALAGKPNFIPEASVEKFFRALAHHPGPQVPPVRRPVRVGSLAAETGLSVKEVRTIADTFRAEGCHLLMPPPLKVPALSEQTFLDISHESLLRQWKRLDGWLKVEWTDRRMAEDLDQSMRNWRKAMKEWDKSKEARRKKGFRPLREIVRRYVRWKQAGESVATLLYRDTRLVFFPLVSRPAIPAWAKRYGIDWVRVDRFCRVAFLWKKATAVISKMGAWLVLLTLMLVMAVIWAVQQTDKAEKSAENETYQRKKAESLAKEAGEASKKAEQRRAEAEKLKEDAENLTKEAVGKLSASETDFRLLSDTTAQFLSELQAKLQIRLQRESGDEMQKDSAKQTAEMLALFKAPEYSKLTRAVATAGTDIPAPSQRVTLSAPLELTLDLPAKPAPAPVTAFLRTERGLYVLTGSKGVRKTQCWALPGGEVKVLPFESGRFISGPDAEAVASLADEAAEVNVIKGPENILTSGKISEAIKSATMASLRAGKIFVFGTGSGKVGAWDMKGSSVPPLFLTGETGIIKGLDFAAASNVLAATGDDWAKCWRIAVDADGNPAWKPPAVLNTFRTKGAIPWKATIHSGGQLILLPTGNELPLRPLGSGTEAVTVLQHPPDSTVRFAKFSPDGTMLASSDTTGRVYLWDVSGLVEGDAKDVKRQTLPREAPQPVMLPGHRSDLTGLEWAPGSGYLVTADGDGLAIIWTSLAARLKGDSGVPFLLPRHPNGVSGVAISPDERLIVTAGADGLARVYPLRAVMQGKFRAWSGVNAAGAVEDGDMALLSESGAQSKENRFNPGTPYIRARWDYSFTPQALLRTTKVILRRVQPSGLPGTETVEVQPAGWGPPVSSGRDFDLSPAAVAALKLGPEDTVQVEVPVIAEKEYQKTRTPNPGPVDPEETVNSLIAKLSGADEESMKAAGRLARIGQSAVKPLLAAAAPGAPDRVRYGVATALSKMKQPVLLDAADASRAVSLIEPAMPLTETTAYTSAAAVGFLIDLTDAGSITNVLAALEVLVARNADSSGRGSPIDNAALVVVTWARTLSSSIKAPETGEAMKETVRKTARRWRDEWAASKNKSNRQDALELLDKSLGSKSPAPKPIVVTIQDEHEELLPNGDGWAVYLCEFSKKSESLGFYIFKPSPQTPPDHRHLEEVDFLQRFGRNPPVKQVLPVKGSVKVKVGNNEFVVTAPSLTAGFGKNDYATLQFKPDSPR